MSVTTYIPSNRIVHQTQIDFTGRYVSIPVHLVQGDHVIPIVQVRLFENGKIFDLRPILNAASSAEINTRCKDSRNNTIYIPALGISSDGTSIFFEVNKIMTQKSGKLEIVLEIKCDGSIVNTSIIVLDVDENPVDLDQELDS